MEIHQDIRWIQRLSNFSWALSQLEAAVSLADQRPLSELEQQGMIQSFEYTHELSWNVLRDYLKDQGTQQLFGSKDTVRAAFAVGLIQDGEAWMEMIRDRNRSYLTYNVEVANAIVTNVIYSYIHKFKDLRKTCEGLAHEIKT
ncbi:MAG: nucleotidyltransferase substrate binding protein [Bacteroidales bacterium]|jgi:nucleotidyltransferase substrate binding protein (TIGR01987 family)|nr:nucleotidyltransferase substrate binding protein [Bacteroidales bacterium]